MSWYKEKVAVFITTAVEALVNQLAAKSAERFSGDQRSQMRAWTEQVQLLQDSLRELTKMFEFAFDWGIIIEHPLLRLQRRLDAVLIAGDVVAVIEFKVGAVAFLSQDTDQAMDYCLDLRDFHAGSHSANLLPILCATGAETRPLAAC